MIGPADLTVAEGESLIVYAVGSLDDENLSVLTETITGLHDTPNAVNTGDSPVGSSSSSTTVLVALAALISAGGVATFGARRLRPVAADA